MQLSSGSRMPSPSVSGIGQPSGSTPTSSGHLSVEPPLPSSSQKPSPSMSDSGQPSSSLKSLTVSARSTHWSSGSRMPSPSASRTGQPSGATPASSGQVSSSSQNPSPSRS